MTIIPDAAKPVSIALQRCAKTFADGTRALEPLDLTVSAGETVYEHLRSILAPLKAPIVAMPGNHDSREAMRAAFAADGYFPRQGFLQFATEFGELRLIGLDTLSPGQGAGELCAERLAWLELTLSEKKPSRRWF